MSLITSTSAQTRPTAFTPAPLFKEEIIASDLKVPWALKFLPDGRVMFTERAGRVRIIQDGKLLPEPALMIGDVKTWNKMGVLGLAIDPDFASNHFVYLATCYGTSNDHGKNFERIVRYREADNRLIEAQTLLDGIPAFWNHNGCRLTFGPDGKLYITTGDADEPPLSQRLDSLAGKVLRINPDGTIPTDNPFVNQPNARPEVWSYGHRNPQGIAFQPGTDELFECEHGPDGGDEINFIRKGQNYGWPFITHDRTASGVESPLQQFTPAVAPSAMVFYDGAMFPALRGDLLVTCLRCEAILRVHIDGQKVTSVERLIHGRFGRLREIAVAPDGALWITTSEQDAPEGKHKGPWDQIIRLTPAGGTVATIDRVPTAKDIPHPVGAKAIYAQMCVICHGDGDRSLNSNLFDRKWDLSDGSDPALRQVIRDGNMMRGMPGFGASLNAKEIDEVIAYLHEREGAAK